MRIFIASNCNHPPIYCCWLLIFLITTFIPFSEGFRKARGRLLGQSLLPFGYTFEFNAPEYNVSLKENTRNRAFIQIDGGEKIGVFLPPIFSKIRYKIVDGDKDKLFTAEQTVLGDFAFLQIRPAKGEILNRERKSHYELLIKATLKRKNANTLETTAKVNLKILDENDNNPMFKKIDYIAEVDTETPLNSRIIRLEAFDADEGLNAEIYYSMTNSPNDSATSMFYVDTRTGWIRNFAPLKTGNYSIDAFVEDRTSRLQFYGTSDSPKPMFFRNKAKAIIIVKDSTAESELKIAVEKFPLKLYQKIPQKAAKIIIENAEEGTVKVETKETNNFWIEENSEGSGFWLMIGRTENKSMEATIIATEIFVGNRKAEKSLTINMDSDSRKLEFVNKNEFKNIRVDESLPIGFIVYQFEVNGIYAEEKDLIRYRLRTDSKNFPFHLDRTSGQLRIKASLDYESIKSYDFIILTKLDGFDEVQSEENVKITIIDSNDNCPQFSSLPAENQIILKNATPKMPIFTIKAVDIDSEENGRIFYRLSGDSGFSIDAETGELSTSGALAKGKKHWGLKVIAFDAGSPISLSSEVQIDIFASAEDAKTSKKVSSKKATDTCSLKNNHSPKFAKLPSNLSIKEDAKIGTTVTKIEASDGDYGINGIIQFWSEDEFFGIDTYSGIITVKKSLFELFNHLNNGNELIDYKIEISATDSAIFVNPKMPSLSTKTSVTIQIHDVNNYSPIFEQPIYFTQIEENAGAGIELLRVKAFDQDPGRNGKVEYLLAIDSDLITIDPDTGVIRTEKSFDREISLRKSEYNFLLGAFDRANPSNFGFANLTIKVIDKNDNSPKCLNEIHEFKMFEDAPRGQLVGCIGASDMDLDENARLTFEMGKSIPRAPFRLDNETGCIFLDSINPLSAERHSRYSFNISVADHGSPSLSTTCQVKIDLISVNRNQMPPEFEQIAVDGSIKENSPIGTEVLQVSAIDPEGKTIIYELIGGSGLGYFDIDEESGLITSAIVFDYEATSSYWLTVRASDSDIPSLSGYLSVLVRILDQNDRAPIFEKPIYFAKIEENSPENKVVIKVEAEDPDSSATDDSNLRYSIVRGNTQSLFHIDPNTGYIVTGKRKLDREHQKEHELIVRVCDTTTVTIPSSKTNNNLCADALVVIAVEDINDNRPLFNTTTNLNMQVPANRIGFLTRIFAYDADSDGPNSEIEYSFIGPLVDERLRIDKYGRISTVEALKSGSQVHVTVLAKDSGEPRLNSSVTLILEPLGRTRKSEATNQKPKFIEKETWKELYVSDGDPVGVIVGLVRAQDDDNDPLWYSIASDSENPNETFAFKSASGELILARSVNLIDPSLSEIKLSVAVSDGVAEVIDKLTIKISRSASIPRPEFSTPSDSITLTSLTPVGVILYTAKAKFDETRTGISHPHRLLYSIHHVDDIAARESIRIDAHSGDLSLEKSLTPQTAKNFTVIISAKVGASENFLQLLITRQPTNEHPPKFINKKPVIQISASTSPETIIGSVKAFDADKDLNLKYSIIGGNEFGLFSIDSKNASIKLIKILPNLFKEAALTIRVTDSGEIQKSSTIIVKIEIKEGVEQQRPHFSTSESLIISTSDEIAVGGILGHAKIVPSSDRGSLQTTSLAFDGLCEYLNVHFTTGIIRLRKTLPLKDKDWTINCTLFAINENGNNASIGVHLKIASTKSQAIKFGENSEMEAFIQENSPIGSLLFSDKTEISPLIVETFLKSKLRILSPRESHFSIDSHSGTLRVLQPIDYEISPKWHLFITATKLGTFPYFVSAPIKIKIVVGNENDVSPKFQESQESSKMEIIMPPIVGTKIGQLYAIDNDGDNVTFGLRQNTDNLKNLQNILSVNRTTGEIFLTTNKTSDFKETSFSIPVIASDGIHSSDSTIEATIIDSKTKDVPTNKLRFMQSQFRLLVTENSTTPTPKTLLLLEMTNEAPAESFAFEILNPHPAFQLLKTSGILQLINGKEIDREKSATIELLIRATSMNNQNRSATTVILIDIEDINDSAPEFLGLPYHVTLSEDSQVNDRLISVKARDSDLSINGVVRYSLGSDAPPFLDINKYDGRIILNSKPNLRQGQEFNFTVIAKDTGKPMLESTEIISVSITNKYQPTFSHNRYSTKISESAAPGTTVISVRATAKLNGIVGYRIKGGDLQRQFSIDFKTGTISVNLPLNREVHPSYQLIIEAIDVTRIDVSGICVVEIVVEDVNDSPPEFDQLLYIFNISEAATIGTFIGKISAKDAEASIITYSIADGNRSIISIDPTTGQLHLLQSLDYEEQNFYEFTVIARDIDRLSTESILQINILDSNDSPPKFVVSSKPLQINLNIAELKLHQFIYKFTVSDSDSISSLPNNDRFRFTFIDGDETLFQIDSKEGVLRAASILDTSQLIQLTQNGILKRMLNISVSDGIFDDYLQVFVNIKPSGNGVTTSALPLHFEQSLYTALVNENRPVTNRSAILIVQARGGENPLKYSIAGNSKLPISIDSNSGRVYLTKSLQDSFEIPIQVEDGNERKAFSKLKISIRDENDQSPYFVAPSNGYSLCSSTASQQGESIAAILALDSDVNDQIEYSLITGNGKINAAKYLEIDSQSGYLSLKESFTDLKPLPSEIDFGIRVSDSGNPPHSAQISMKIKVVDIPQIVPQFSRLSYLFAISEDASIGKVIGQLQLEEEQPGHLQKTLKYSIISKNDETAKLPFTLDEKSGKIILKSLLDREKIEKYYFVAQVQDSDGLHSFAIVTIAVMDINDNYPTFVTTFDKITVMEDIHVGSVIATFIANDIDEGPNSHISYSFESDDKDLEALKVFSLDREYGWLSLSESLDRENKSKYNLKVIASDDSGKNTSMPVVIVVEDINDTPPIFEKDKYKIEIDKNAVVGSQLLKFTVKDSDKNSDVQLFIISGNSGDYFEIRKHSLYLKRNLATNSVLMSSMKLEIVASDGAHSTSTQLIIKVKSDQSKISKIFCSQTSMNLTIAGNLTSESTIANLPSSSTSEAVFNHLLDAERLPFKIKNNSELIVKESYAKQRHYSLKLKSRKELKSPIKPEPSCLQIIEIYVENANLRNPKFEKSVYNLVVKEDVPVSEEQGYFLIQIQANDDDFDDYGKIEYSLVNSTGKEGMFAVEKHTGAIILKASLDRETQDNYEIFVKASDGGGLSDYAKIIIKVDDVNDNPPIFDKPVYRLKVLEDEAIGYEILRVKAIDQDSQDTVTYSLVPGTNNFSTFVNLNPETGVLKLAKQLDFEKFKEIKLDILAADNGKPSLNSTCTVEIEILDVNDNSPRFSKTLYEANLKENVPVGTKVVQVMAKDLDSEHFGKVSYSLNGEDSEYFEIDDGGWILTAKNIDFEEKNLLRTNVKAVDGGLPPQGDDTLISITVIDENDNPPIFSDCNMSAVVQEGVAPGHVLLTATLTDKDGPPNTGPFKVEISGDGSDAFAFDQEMHLIVTKKLSYTEKSLYNLKATAFDTKGLSSKCPIQIHVKRQSTHPPQLHPLVITLNTLHGEFLGGSIGKIKATDKDVGDMLRFAIVENSFAPTLSKFTINPESGELTAQADLLPGLHRLNVSVTDGKFTEYGRIDVDVANIDQDALDHSVSLRIKSISAKKFIKHFSRRFHEILSHLLGIPPTDLRFLSIQEVEQTPTIETAISVPAPTSPPQKPQQKPHRKFFKDLTKRHAMRHKRGNNGEPDLDILFTVRRGENHGYHRPPWVRQNIEKQSSELSTESGLEIISLTSEVCRRDVCVKGECRDRLWLDNAQQQLIYEVDEASFVSPKHLRTFECICKQGYSGRHCDVPVNMCSKDLCTKHEMCIPSDDEPSGFRCVCPPGFKGSQCSEPTCEDASACSQKEELSLMGNGYIQLFVSNSMETRLELNFQFKTVSSNAVLMYGEGLDDFQSVEITNGTIEYKWNCGTGIQAAQIPLIRVDDGHWHEFKIARRGRHVRIVLDNSHESDATSPPGSDVVNLFHQATLLTFGAKVSDPSLSKSDSTKKVSAAEWFKRLIKHSTRQVATDLYTRVDSGMIGCFGKISFDGYDLSKTSQGMRLFNAKIGCDTSAMGPCLSSPCSNGGQCIPAQNGFTCICPKRFTGANCEIDLNACESRPCPNGIACHNLYNDFHCSCPAGFTGKTCQMRGDWDPCVTSPCGPYGSCVRQGASFICNCSGGFGGAYCHERVPNLISDGAAFFSSTELIILIALLLVALIIAVVVILLCRKSNKSAVNNAKKSYLHDYDDPVNRPLVPRHGNAPPVPPHGGTNERGMTTLTTNVASAPPLPPRIGRQQQNLVQHIYTNATNLPTVEVRPMFNNGQRNSQKFLHGRDSCSSPSSSSNGKPYHKRATSGTSSNLDCSRNYGSAADDLEQLSKEEISSSRRFIPLRSSSREDTSYSSRQGSSSGFHGDVSNSIPLLSNGRSLGDSIQCLPTTEEIEINLDEDDDQMDTSERDAMLSELRKEQNNIQEATEAWNDKNEIHDYVTMKPINRIKPFSVSKSNTNFPDIDADSESRESEPPPPPPAHRISKVPQVAASTRTDTTKLYDNPNDDTLSNITSNGLDD